MIKSELLFLSDAKSDKKKILHKKLLHNLKKDIYNIISDFNAYLIQTCNYFQNFTGMDVDAFYEKKNKYETKAFKNTIVRNKDNGDLRLHINNSKGINFLSLDIEDLSNLPEPVKQIFKKKFNKKIFCKYTRLNHLDNKSIIFYKLYKYFFVTIRSFDQLGDLKKKFKKLEKRESLLILKSAEKALPNEFGIIKKFLFWKFEKFSKNKDIKKFFLKKKNNKQKKRKIFAGKLYLKKVILSKKFIYAILFGKIAKWKKIHNPMPAVAIIGNDGSGKTTVVEYIRKKFYKMDPLILDMKSTAPFFPLLFNIRQKIKKIKKYSIIKKIFFLNTAFSLIGEFCDLIDKYFKYKVGMAWADAGYGLTIFERYPTDRIRGEFPNKKNKFLPLEQFFPFPDGIVYLDVLPQESINRKKKDNHSLDEMISKRKNYLSLINEFDEVEKLSPSKDMNKKILKTKNYIFDLYKRKKNQIQKSGKIKRVIWSKNYNRVLAGDNLNRFQKTAFFN
jgi:hypothetical protein